MTNITRKDFHVKTHDNVSIAIREVRQTGNQTRVPMILLHGTRIPGLSEYDLDVPNGSLAEDLAKQGHVVYIVDARGFGRSERPAEMDEPRQSGKKSLIRTIEITHDVDAAVNHLIKATGQKKVALFGWGVGGTCIQMYASLHPKKVSHLIFYNTIYGGYKRPTPSAFAHPDNPEIFNQEKYGNYYFNSIELLEEHWDTQIPIEDKAAWRDPAMVKAFSQALLDGDPTSMERTPPSYRSPNGMLEDLFRMSRGEKLMHANQIYAKVMIVNPELDTLSKDEDMAALIEDLCHAEQVLHYAPKNTTHYILLDRPERGRNDLLAKMDEFLY
ncbi:MAG: alpha/beta fold hydrolase [Alphaproteobacteria bacterium]|nr:alpha/beta fold hydrolase [Alphaproteobacteria bacterium]